MKIYFDTCSLNRPLDDHSQLRVALEAEAVLGLLALCESDTAMLVASEVLDLENDRNPLPQRKAFVAGVLEGAKFHVKIDDNMTNRANDLQQAGFKAFDALHIACAEAEGVEYFCTCDDRLLPRSQRQSDISVQVASPLQLADEIAP